MNITKATARQLGDLKAEDQAITSALHHTIDHCIRRSSAVKRKINDIFDAVAAYLQQQRRVTALDVQHRFGLSHEDTYATLTELHAHGLARVVVHHHRGLPAERFWVPSTNLKATA